MRLPELEIDDTAADRLLRAFGASAEDFADPSRKAIAAALIATHLLNTVELPPAAAAADREEVERELLALAAAPVAYEAKLDARGEPAGVWIPGSEWRSIENAPARWVELETALRTVYDLLAVHPELRTLATLRLTARNEEQTEMIIANPLEPVAVETRLDGVRHRFTLAPDGALVVGIPLEDPRPIRER